jgi:hypothetical protein
VEALSTSPENGGPTFTHDERPRYAICLYTEITEPEIAFELAVKISESLADNEQVDDTATTIGIEADLPGHERIYAVHVGPQLPDVLYVHDILDKPSPQD